MSINWSTERRKVSELRDYSKNPRKFTDKGMKDLAESINRLGYIDPIAINLDGTIIGGHARKGTLKKLGIKEVDVRVPDRQLTEKEVEEAIIRLNKNIAGEWDLDKLALNFEQSDLIDWGFEPGDFGVEPEVVEGLTDEDAVPEPSPEPITKLGDIWILGNHRVMCGDSTSIDAVEKLMDGQKADMVFTDPPYGINIVNVGTKKVGGDSALKFKTASVGGSKIVDAKQYAPIIGDETIETARAFYNTCLAAGIENFIIFGGNYFTDFLPPSPCWVVWDKQNTGNFADVELAWTSHKGGAKLYSHLWNGLARKGDHKTELSTRVHPTQKPVGLFEEIFKDFKFTACFDGFLGSGSTLIACEKTNRTCYGMELSPQYCDVIVKRWEDFTGKKAVLEDRK